MPNMASRRSYRNLKQNSTQDYKVLKLNDVLCPICRSILIEPVTLPCSHGFCLSCFKSTVENANLVCPLCRIRIGSWLRKTKKESNLINVSLWEAIKHNYAQHVKNKLDGIDENLEEESRVIVSLPGEIRKEYEIQKQKDQEELRKIREAQNKASEELIKKLREEEDYQKAVMEEKIRLDEEIAKRIAAELVYKGPSTSKSSIMNNTSSKSLGPMDRFIRRDNETVTSQTINSKEDKLIKKFSEKEYTCRVLYLDRKADRDVPKTFSPIIKKKIQQIQKSCESDPLNDSFECFEADMRYFKPIDNKFCPPTVGKPPIKVPCRKAFKNGAAKILSPSGEINFRSNFLESAFARISMTSPMTLITKKTSNIQECGIEAGSLEPYSVSFKRRYSIEDTQLPHKKFVKDNNISPALDNCEKMKFVQISYNKTKKCPLKRNSITRFRGNRESPPFFGFDNSLKNDTTREIVEDETEIVTKQQYGNVNAEVNTENLFKSAVTAEAASNCSNQIQDLKNNTEAIRKNGNMWMEDESYKQKLLQEKTDLELAKKLQKEFDKYAHYTRSSRKVGRRGIQRQTTLDQILTGPYRVK